MKGTSYKWVKQSHDNLAYNDKDLMSVVTSQVPYQIFRRLVCDPTIVPIESRPKVYFKISEESDPETGDVLVQATLQLAGSKHKQQYIFNKRPVPYSDLLIEFRFYLLQLLHLWEPEEKFF